MLTDDDRQSIDAAKIVLIQAIEDGVGISEAIKERAAEAVHLAWKSRHSRHALGHRPYADLPEAEKEKDRKFVRLALEEIGSVST